MITRYYNKAKGYKTLAVYKGAPYLGTGDTSAGADRDCLDQIRGTWSIVGAADLRQVVQDAHVLSASLPPVTVNAADFAAVRL